MERETMEQAIGSISDKYLEETLDYRAASGNRKRSWCAIKIAAVFAICIGAGTCIAMSGMTFGIKPDIFSARSEKGSGLTITAYASVSDEQGKVLTLGEKIVSKYSLASSVSPGLPLSFEYSGEDVGIQVTAPEGGRLCRYRVDPEGIWNLTESGKTLYYSPDERMCWIPEDVAEDTSYTVQICVFVKKILVERKTISITASGTEYTASLDNKTGIESKEKVVGEAMKLMQKMGAYAPDLCAINEDYLAFTNLQGMVIYDRENGKVASVIDLQELDCNNFDSDSRFTRILPTDNGMILFNEKAGKTEDTYYKVSFQDGLEKPEITRCSQKETGKDLKRRYSSYQSDVVRETDWNLAEKNLYSERDLYSRNSLCWQAGQEKNRSFLGIHTESSEDDKCYYIVLHEDRNTGKVTREKLNIDLEWERNDGDKLPEFTYRGKDEIRSAIYNHLMAGDAYSVIYQEEDEQEGSICIPFIQYHYGTVKKKDKIVMFCAINTCSYIKTGDILEEMGGSVRDAKIVLEKNNGSYTVKQIDVVKGDGAKHFPALKKVLKGYPELIQDYLDFDFNKPYTFRKEQRHVIRQYVKNNGLDIKYFKAYGWDKVKL